LKWYRKALILVALGGAVFPAYGLESPRVIVADVDRDGPKAVVDRLYRDHQWEALLARVDRGSHEWLVVAEKVYPGTDAATREGLNISLALALPRNAGDVLAMLGTDAGLPRFEDICSVPFVEPDEQTVARHRAQVRAALGRVISKALSESRGRCLAVINQRSGGDAH
jgi:hypothetical protein